MTRVRLDQKGKVGRGDWKKNNTHKGNTVGITARVVLTSNHK